MNNNPLISWSIADLVLAASRNAHTAYRKELERRAGSTGHQSTYAEWETGSLKYQLTLAERYSKTLFLEPKLHAKWGLALLDIKAVLALRGKEEVESKPAPVVPEETVEMKLRGRYTIVHLEQSGEYTIVNLRLMK